MAASAADGSAGFVLVQVSAAPGGEQVRTVVPE